MYIHIYTYIRSGSVKLSLNKSMAHVCGSQTGGTGHTVKVKLYSTSIRDGTHWVGETKYPCVVSEKQTSWTDAEFSLGEDSSVTFTFYSGLSPSKAVADYFNKKNTQYTKQHYIGSCNSRGETKPENLSFAFGGRLHNLGNDRQTARIWFGQDTFNNGHYPWFVTSPDMTFTCESGSDAFTGTLIPLSPSSQPELPPTSVPDLTPPPPPRPPKPWWKKAIKVLVICAILAFLVLLVLKLRHKSPSPAAPAPAPAY